ncbi:MAG: DUF433 domain-containing protein [Sphingomonas bacterium]
MTAIRISAQISVMALAQFPRISVDPAVCGGRPVVAGTRMRVSDILDMLADGATEAQIADDFPYIVPADIRACLNFAARSADHPVVTAAE